MKDFLQRKYPKDSAFHCVECYMRDGRIIPPAGLCYNGEKFIVHPFMSSFIPGVFVVTPKEHVGNIEALSCDDAAELANVTVHLQNALLNLGFASATHVMEGEHLKIVVFPLQYQQYVSDNAKFTFGEEFLGLFNLKPYSTQELMLPIIQMREAFKAYQAIA